MSHSERHLERRRQRAKQKEKENNMRTYRSKDSVINLAKATVQKKSWLSGLGAGIKALWSRIKGLWPGDKAPQAKESRP